MRICLGLLHRVDQQHRDRVGFLARGTAGDPDSQRRGDVFGPHQILDHFLIENMKCLGIAEEARHADQQIFAELRGLLILRAKEFQIPLKPIDLAESHAVQDSPLDHPFAVAAKIVLAFGPQDIQDLVQLSAVLLG
jgi:hypothetical protein